MTTETYEKEYMIRPYGVYLRNAKSIIYIYIKGHTNTIKDKIHMLISADIKKTFDKLSRHSRKISQQIKNRREGTSGVCA